MLRIETKASQLIHFKLLPNVYGCIFLDLGSKGELNKKGDGDGEPRIQTLNK